MRKLTLLCLLLLSSSLWLKGQDKSLNGKWFLEEIVLKDSIIHPERNKFYLVFDGVEILFNKEKNRCGMTATIQNNLISDCYGSCTKICCDEWYGTTSQYFNANGSYEIKGSILELKNKWGLLKYRKSTPKDD